MKKQPGYDKLRGGYYTPQQIVRFIVDWVISDKDTSILEPSCGDGGFLKYTVEKLKSIGSSSQDSKKNVFGVELDKTEAAKAQKTGATVINSDFFRYYKEDILGKKTFDAIIGNPPFIRYQDFDEDSRKIAFELMEEIELHPNRLTNIWIPFLVLSSESLSKNGKLGMVIPAELFQVNYAAEIREYLSNSFDRLTVITFKELLFPGAQQEVVILLGEKTSTTKGIRVVELQGLNNLQEYTFDNNPIEVKELDHTSDKWTKYYLTNEELKLIAKLQKDDRMTALEDILEANVGVVSGQNDFFIIDKDTVDENKLQKYVIPIVGKAEQLSGLIFTENDYSDLSKKQRKIHFFVPRDLPKSRLSKTERKYIKYGEDSEYNIGYKCRIRKRWYTVPQSWNPEAFFLRQVHKYPRIVINETNATVTDTLHKIRFNNPEQSKIIAAAFLNSFTFALSEITGRSYGGGVLTFEPSEVRKLQVPLQGAEQLDIEFIDKLIRNNAIYEVLEYVDRILLREALGYSEDEVIMLRGIWEKLCSRRINRRNQAD